MAPPPPSQALPLPTNFFHTKALDARTQQTLLHTAQTCGAHLLQNAYSMDDHLVYAMHTDPTSQRRMKMVLGKDSIDPALTCMVGHTQFHSSLEDISTFFRRESLSAACNDGLVLDSHHLYTLASSTKDDPLRYTGVHWAAFKLPSPSTAPRDYCYLESHSEFTNPKTSKRGWLRVIHSVDVAACPSLLAPCGLLRSRWYRSGHVFIENRNGLVDCYAVLAGPSGDTSQNSAQMSFMRKWVTQVMAVPNLFLSRRLASTPLLPDDALRPKDSVKTCMVCTTRFNLFNQRHHCRVCGQIVCSSCHITWKFPNRKEKVRVCVKCTESSGDAAPTMRESFSNTWNSSVASRGQRRQPPTKQPDATCQRGSFSSETPSMDMTTKSGCSDDLVLFDPDCLSLSTTSTIEWDAGHAPKPAANYDHLFDFSVLQAPPTHSTSSAHSASQAKTVLYASPAAPTKPAPTLNSSRTTLYSGDLLADLAPTKSSPPMTQKDPRKPIDMDTITLVDAAVLAKSRRRMDESAPPPPPTYAGNVTLHELLERMYDNKSEIVQGLYRDLVAQTGPAAPVPSST